MSKKKTGQSRTKYGARESDVRVIEAYSLPEGLRDKIRDEAKARKVSRSALAAELLRAGIDARMPAAE